jgi:hypothetical protein
MNRIHMDGSKASDLGNQEEQISTACAFSKGSRAAQMINYDGRIFRMVNNSENGDAGSETLFFYHEKGGLVWAEYCGGSVIKGMLLATKAADGSLDMRYQHVNSEGGLMTGLCNSTVSVLADGRYRLEEKWQWTSGDCSEGKSTVEETSPSKEAERAPSRGFSVTGLC